MIQKSNQKVLSLLILLVLTLTNYMEVKAGPDTREVPSTWTNVRFNSDVRYSQWIINSRINDFYANSAHVSFGKYSAAGAEEEAPIIVVKNKNTVLDYVPGLVAKAIVENVKQNVDYSWAAPWYYSMKTFGDTYYNAVTSNGTSGKSQDDLNGIKMYFALKDLTASGAKYENSTTYGHCNSVMADARTGLNALNTNYIIGGSKSGISEAKARELGMYGGWWHKSSYNDQMWCDGLYMGPALLAQLINEYPSYTQINTNDGEDDWDLITRLFTISWNQLYDSNTGLLYHAFTANPKDDASSAWEGISNTSGSEVYHSAAFWGRACGWYFLALVDILEQMDVAGKSGTTNYATLKGYLNSLAAGLANYQDATTGCWYQVLDEKDNALSGNYLESSCTAIFAAAYLKGIRLGYFTADYTTVAQKAYEGCVNQFMMFDANDKAQLIHCCASAGLGGNNNRSGSRSYYITGYNSIYEDVIQRNTFTEGKVLGGFILAATEYERTAAQTAKSILFSTDLKASYDLEANESITIEACGADDAEISYEWYKVGEANAVATGATFTPTASGSYYCKATSGTTTIQSSTTNVTVPGVDTETPVFTTDLAATATATVGTAKTLTVAASHADGYQWYSNTTASNTSGTEIENATSASYTFTPSAAGTLYYYCVATNSNATGTQSVASAVCTVTVSEAPAETTYTVTFNATTNGGTCATASLTQASSGASITLPTATKSGYTFNGWYTASTGGTLRGAANASYTPTADETLYAQFNANSQPGGEGNCTITIGNSNSNSYATSFTSSSTNGSVTASATAFTVGSSIGTSNSTNSYATAPYSVKYKPSGNINTSEYSDNYSISAQFTVASGYTFTPSAISATIVTEATGYTYQAILTDGTTTYTSNDVASSSNGVSTFSFPSLSGTALSGTVTFKIRFKSTANNSKYFIVNLPITISGEVNSAGGEPSKTTNTLALTTESGEVTEGNTLDITSYVSTNSDATVTYTSNNPEVATVENGVITGVSEGTTTITVEQEENEDYTSGSTAFTITVNPAPVPTTNYTVKFYNGNTQFGDSQSIEEGSTVSAPATSPTKDGYTFKGWALSEGSTARVLFPYPIYKDVNFYAVWSNSTSGGGGEEEEIFKAVATTALKVAKETTNNNLSSYATITGGSMYANNGETSDKDMIKTQSEVMAFQLPNSSTIFKVTLNKALEAGDKINAETQTRTDTEVGLWLLTSTSRPKSAPAATMTLATASTAEWVSLPEYTVETGDGICGETTFYIHRCVGKTVYFTNFTITREGEAVGSDITLETVSDYENFESYAGENKTVTFKRNFTEGKWTTLVLPFSVNATQLGEAFEYANDCELANIQSMTVNEQGTGSISYVTTNQITANTPVLAKIKPNDGLTGGGFTANEYVFSGVTVVNSETATATSNDGNVTMYGVYENTARSGFSSLADEEAYFLYNGKFYDFSWLSNMTPFTAYIVPETTSGNALKGLTFEEDSATGIINLNVNPNLNSLSHGEGWGESFNLAGQKVGKEYKGMVIKKGKKVIKK